MFIHFAFGKLGKEGKIEEQTKAVIDCILKEERLKVSKCTEFMPEFPELGTKRIPTEMFREAEYGLEATFYPKEDPNWFNKLPDDDSIYYLQRDVPMICFIKITFNQLRASNHCMEYGKFGIVLNDRFLKSKGIRPVKYYTEESLWNDPLIRKWNYELKSLPHDKREDCEKEILTYRKPATYFSTFKKSVIAKITTAPSGRTIEFLKYDRYEEGYDFTREHEYRIVLDEGVDYLYFGEKDLFMVITPDITAQRTIQDFFSRNWKEKPRVTIYPN
jgi:hypothetical protein